MRIVLKPLGAVAILGAIILLVVIAFRNKSNPEPVSNRSSSNTFSTISGADKSSPVTATAAVYRDGLENGWQERGWAKAIDYRNTVPARGDAGTSIRVEAGPHEAVKMFHPDALDLTRYKRFVCYVNGGDKGGQSLVLNAIAGGKNQGRVSFAPLPPKQWVLLSVPLTELDVQERRDFNAFWIQNMSAEAAPAFYVDDVQFVAAESPSGSDTPLPFAKVLPATPTAP